MSAKRSLIVVITGTVLLLIGLFFLQLPTSVSAQCGNPPPSSCTTCHAQQDPVTDKGAWHSSHAAMDICINCHGGNGTAADKNLAHQGMAAQPLSDVYTDCHSCHTDYMERAVPYAATLQITPSSCATPTPAVFGRVSSSLPPNGMVMSSNEVGASAAAQIFLFVAGGLTLLVLFCIGACWLGEHRVKG